MKHTVDRYLVRINGSLFAMSPNATSSAGVNMSVGEFCGWNGTVLATRD